jgi:hypothetical protein
VRRGAPTAGHATEGEAGKSKPVSLRANH